MYISLLEASDICDSQFGDLIEMLRVALFDGADSTAH